MKMYVGIILLFIFGGFGFAAEDDWMKKAKSSKGTSNFNGTIQHVSIEPSHLKQSLGLQTKELQRGNQNGSIPVRLEKLVVKSGLSGNNPHRSDANGNSQASRIQNQ